MKLKTTILLSMASLTSYAADNKTWSGCYAGASASQLKSNNQWTTTFIGEPMNDNAGSASANETDIGIQFGCDFFETKRSIWGLKVMASDAKLHAEHVYNNTPATPSNVISYDTEDVLSLVGRYGYKVSENGLLYGQLGYVQADNHYEDNDLSLNIPFTFEQNLKRNGLMWGVGYEHQLYHQVSFFVEYNMTDFGKEKVNLIDVGSSNIFDYQANIDQDLSQLNLGVNWRF